MKIGFCCGDTERIKLLCRLGYDFVELGNTELYNKSEEDFNKLVELKKELPEGFMYSVNGLVPGELRLTGPDVDYDKIRQFAKKSFARLNQLGIKMIVFGSGKAKHVPEGFSFETAMEQLVKVVNIFSEEASVYGMKVCIEPLRRGECNIINTAGDSIKLAKLSGCSNVGGHVDFYHIMQNGEKLSTLTPLAKDIFHTHIASPIQRTMVTYDDGADYKAFFDFLRAGGYDATVSFEGGTNFDETALGTMLSYLKSL